MIVGQLIAKIENDDYTAKLYQSGTLRLISKRVQFSADNYHRDFIITNPTYIVDTDDQTTVVTVQVLAKLIQFSYPTGAHEMTTFLDATTVAGV